jgi:hypothetical protein
MANSVDVAGLNDSGSEVSPEYLEAQGQYAGCEDWPSSKLNEVGNGVGGEEVEEGANGDEAARTGPRSDDGADDVSANGENAADGAPTYQAYLKGALLRDPTSNIVGE